MAEDPAMKRRSIDLLSNFLAGSCLFLRILINSPSSLTVPLIFFLNIFLVFPKFFPNLSEIGRFDEAYYINTGKELFQGTLSGHPSTSPLTTFLYALTYIPVQESPYWLIHSCTIGRLILFILFWLSFYLIAKQMSDFLHPLIMILLLFVSPALTFLTTNGSHALFTAMSAFAFSQVVSFFRRNHIKHLWLASTFVALAVLCRYSEGLILFLSFIIIVFLSNVSYRRIHIYLGHSVFPFVIIISIYMLANFPPVWSLQFDKMRWYSYLTFEQGHGLAFLSKESNFYVDGQIEARRVFGTPEENQYSVLIAIHRNPMAYLERIPRLVGLIPIYGVNLHGGGLAVLFILFAIRGIIELVIKKRFILLFVLLSWLAYSLLYILLVFQHTHLLSQYFVILTLSSIGLFAIHTGANKTQEILLWIVAFFVLVILRFVEGTVYIILLTILLGLSIIWTIIYERRELKLIRFIIFSIIIILLIPLKIISNPVNFHLLQFRELGNAPDEKAMLFMREHLNKGARVGAYAPSIVWAAEMSYVPIVKTMSPDLYSEQDLSVWIEHNKLGGIYVDKILRVAEPLMWALIERQIGESLEVAFTADNGNVQVLFVTKK